MNYSAKQTIHVARRPRKGKPYYVDGDKRLEKLPQNRNRVMVVAPSGRVSYLILSSGCAQTGNNLYGMQKRQEKRDAGFLLYHQCPLLQGVVAGDKPGTDGSSIDKKERPCQGVDGKGNHNEGEPCKHMIAVVGQRTEFHNHGQKEYAETLESKSQERLAEILEKMVEQNAGQPKTI